MIYLVTIPDTEYRENCEVVGVANTLSDAFSIVREHAEWHVWSLGRRNFVRCVELETRRGLMSFDCQATVAYQNTPIVLGQKTSRFWTVVETYVVTPIRPRSVQRDHDLAAWRFP